MAESLAERGSTRDSELNPSAHRRSQPAVDEAVEQRVPELQALTRAPAPGATRKRIGLRPAEGDGGIGCGPEDPALDDADGGLLLRGVVDLLENPGHGKQERWPGLREGLRKR